jgi:acetyl-CoA acetyltransferase
MGDVFIAGVGMTRFGCGNATIADLVHAAVRDALADADLPPSDVGALLIGYTGAGVATVADALLVRLGLRHSGLRAGARARIEHASLSGARALHLAWRAIEVGVDDVVVCVGAERAYPYTGSGDGLPPLLRGRIEVAREYITMSGATGEQLARTVVKNRRHGARNPHAMADEVLVGTVLESDVVDWPLTRLMVAVRGEGAAAVVLASPRARRRISGSRPRIRASVLGMASEPNGDLADVAGLAYRTAGIGPEDVDCAELNDVTAAAELAAYEALQFIAAGHGPELIDAGYTSLGGVLPVNTSGGLLSLGELDGASGIAQVCELTYQLRNRAGSRQVPRALVGLAQSSGPAEDGSRVVGLTVLSAT